MSESEIPPQFQPDLEAIQKRIEFEAFKADSEREKDLRELWAEAEEAVRKLWRKRLENEKDFWVQCLLRDYIPTNIPRQTTKRTKLLELIKSKAQLNKRGRPVYKKGVFQLEVGSIREQISDHRIHLKILSSKNALNETLSSFERYLSHPSPSSKTIKEWLPIYVLYFKQKYNTNEMALNASLRKAVWNEVKSAYGYSNSGFYKFLVNDKEKLRAFFTELKQPANSISKYLNGKLPQSSRQKLAKYGGSNSNNAALEATMVKSLNSIIQGPLIYDDECFRGVDLRPGLRKMLEENLQGEDLALLNRLLLEDAYPLEIPKTLIVGHCNKIILKRFRKAFRVYAKDQPLFHHLKEE
jgi:hypothetical protein